MKAALTATIVLALSVIGGAQTQTPPPQTTPPPVPRPFPQSGQPPASSAKPGDPQPTATPQPTSPGPAPQTGPPSAVPSAQDLGIQVPPSAQYLESFDAGRGQRYYIFGTNDAYLDVVRYFKTSLGNGREVFKTPATQWFDLQGRYSPETMAFPPSVVVKDYTWNASGTISEGYVFIDGSKERRYKTIIQIVPAGK